MPKYISRRKAICFFFLVAFLQTPGLGQRRTLRVPQGFKSIQSAVNAARVGDTVLVDHGIYYENVRISKNIVLASHFIFDKGNSHISYTIIYGNRPGSLSFLTLSIHNAFQVSAFLSLFFPTSATAGSFIPLPA